MNFLNTLRSSRRLAGLMALWLTASPLISVADDINIFVGSSAGSAANPNVLIVLDNTSNWARQSQQWPGGLQQGQSEANAIKTVVSTLDDNVNVGLMEFTTEGNANDQGGFIHYAVRPMTSANKAAFGTKLDTIYNNVTSPTQKRNSNTPYGDLMYDVYNYFSGASVSQDGSNNTRNLNPPNTDVDAGGYSTPYTQFTTPLSSANSCARNFVIFIGNPNSSGPATDSSANTSAMSGLSCSTTQLSLPNIGSVPTTTTTNLGNTGLCYSSLAAAQAAYGYAQDPNDPGISRLYASTSPAATATDWQTTCSGYTQGCTITNAASSANTMTCTALGYAAGTQSYHVVETATATPPAPTTGTTDYLATAPTPASPATASSVATTPTLLCPAGYNCTYSASLASTATGGASSQTGTTTGYYTTSSNAQTGISGGDVGGLSCPSNYSCSYAVGNQGAIVASGGGSSGYFTSYTSSAPPTPANIDNATGSSGVAVSGTNLSCPAYNTCTYTVPGSTHATQGAAVGTSSYTTSYQTTTPTCATINNNAGSSSVATAAACVGSNLSCPASNTCTYQVSTHVTASGGTSPQNSTTSSYYTSSSSAQTGIDGGDRGGLSCPSNYACTFTVGSQGSAPGGGGSSTGWFTGYTSAAPSAPATINNTGSTAVGVSGTTLSCPAYSSCTYSVPGTTHATLPSSNSTTTGTTGYLATAPSYATIDNTAGSSPVAVAGTSLSCPAGSSCTYAVAASNTATGGITPQAAYTQSCYASTPTYSTSLLLQNISGSGASATHTATTMTCPVNYSCNYSYTAQASSTKDINNNTCGSGQAIYLITQNATPMKTYTVTQTATTPATYQYNVTQTASTNSAYHLYGVTLTATAMSSYEVEQTATPTGSTSQYNVNQTATGAAYKWGITQTAAAKSTYTITQTPQALSSTVTDLGPTAACYASPPASTTDYPGSCPTGSTCTRTYNTNASTSTGYCGSGLSQYVVQGQNVVYTNGATGTSFADTHPFNADEWSRCLYQKGVPVSGGSNQSVTTYTIDVYNKQPNALQTSLLLSMAQNGGGKYYSATDENAIATALKYIMGEIQSINSTFASASLPINATNRSQNANQVFIGMFRPDPEAKPRWFGNVKRYQLIKDSTGSIQLGDVNGNLAVNNNTGFITDCALSWWTSDSSNYWQAYPINPNPIGTCATSSYNAYSDAPDGPRVEKGAVAEVVRRGNAPASPSNVLNRTIYSASGTTLNTFSAATTGFSTTTTDWVTGQDTQDENSNNQFTEPRASIHGDVVHSRPLPVNYCTTASCDNVVVYYGANDGLFRAVNAQTGQEKWAFSAPEFKAAALDRLRTQSPLVNYPNVAASLGPQPRDYFWDGSIGLYQTAANDRVWIFPTMRRGGRMIYGLDVTNADSPAILWKVGCPNLGDDTGCTTGASGIGQTWSLPNVAFIKGYSCQADALSCTAVLPANTTSQEYRCVQSSCPTGQQLVQSRPVTTGNTGVWADNRPIIVVGGGYDACEDANNVITTECNTAKGRGVYVLDAATGSVIRSFATLRSVPSDIQMIDMDFDGYPDYAYFGDMGGNLYRISFSSYDATAGKYTPLASTNWLINRIGYTNGAGRKFSNSPGIFGASGNVYIALGSGDREHPLQTDYPYTTFCATCNAGNPAWNRFYVYRDCLSSATTSSSITAGDNMDDATVMTNTTSNPGCDGPQTIASNCSSNKGWFTDLNNGAGEETVTAALITGGMATFSTNRPTPAASGSCTTALGEARGYFLNVFNGSGAVGVEGNCGGTKSGTFAGGGLPPSPVLGVVPINGVPTTVVLGAIQKSGGVSSPIAPQKATPTNLPARKRVYRYQKGDN